MKLIRHRFPLAAIALLAAAPSGLGVARPAVGALADEAAAPALADIAFLSGTWRGEMPGGELEEIYTEAKNGTIVGLFRWMTDGATTFTEHITIEQREDGVHMFLRHFHPGNIPWEAEVDGPMHFMLTDAADGRAVFTNEYYAFPRTLTYHLTAPDSMTASLDGKNDDGTPRQLQLQFNRSNFMTTTTEAVNEAATALGYTGGLTIAFHVADLGTSKQWYQDVLGFNLLYEVEDIGWCEMTCPIGGVQIGLSQVESPKVGGPTPTFGVEDIDAARAALESRHVKFDGPTQELPGMVKLATFYDPDGNSLMLYQSLAPDMP